MNNYLVMDAISTLDIDLLASHFKKKEELRKKAMNKKKANILKWSSLAACMCFVIAIGIILIPMIQNFLTEGGAVKYYSLGKTVENEYGSLTLIERDFDNGTCTFTFVKKNNSPICFKFGGVVIKEEYYDESGELHREIQVVDIVTDYENYQPEKGHEVMDVDMTITVNGNIVESIPTTPGEYEIVINYSSLYDALYRVDNMVEVIGFGNFALDDID